MCLDLGEVIYDPSIFLSSELIILIILYLILSNRSTVRSCYYTKLLMCSCAYKIICLCVTYLQ